MKDFTVTEILDEEERRPIYVSLDAKWLDDFSRDLGALAPDSYLRDEDLVRLRVIAERLEKLDEKFRNLTARPKGDETVEDVLVEVMEMTMSGDLKPDTLGGHITRLKAIIEPEAYGAGIIEGKRRYLERSNLPLQSVELTDELRTAIAKSKVPVRRVESTKPKATPKPSPLTLNGIKLNLSGLK